MLWKIYFGFVAFVILFSAYYQFTISRDYNLLDFLNLIADVLLLTGAYCYIFKKKIFSAQNWRLIFKALIVLFGINIIYQVWPSNYLGNFSLLNGSLLTNIFVYLLVTSLFLPLYYAVYQLSLFHKSSKKKR